MSQELNQSSLFIQIASSIESKKSPNYKGGKWSKEEHQKFIEGLFIFGNQWKKMQKYIETRTAIQVRSHSQKFMMKLKKKFIELFGKEELIEEDYEDYDFINDDIVIQKRLINPNKQTGSDCCKQS